MRTAVALLAAAITLAACGTGPPDHVRLGVAAPLSGPRAYLGREMVDGARMAVEDLNDHGGLLGEPVELVVADDSDLVDLPGELADLAERSRVSGIVGPEVPGVLLGSRSPLSRRSVPALLPAAFGGDLGEAPTYVARTVPSARDQAAALARWLTTQRRTDRVAVLVADPVEGRSLVDDLRSGLRRGGARPAAVVAVDATGTADLGPAVARLRDRAPRAGAVLLWGPPPAAARATRAVRQQGWRVQPLVPASAIVAEYRTLAGDASEGVVLAFPFRREWFGRELTRWMIRYHLDHGISALPQLDTLVLDLPVVAAASYDAIRLLASAVRRAGSRRPAAVADALPETTTDGLLATYDLSGHEAWTTDDLHVARFHRLGLIFDVDPRLDQSFQRRFWELQVGARFLPEETLRALLGDAAERLLDQRRGRTPDYRPPRPPPGPVSTPTG